MARLLRSPALWTLLLTLGAGCRSAPPPSPLTYSAGEHAHIGDQVFAQVAPGFRSLLARNDGLASYSYGEISALADFYPSAASLYFETIDGWLGRHRMSWVRHFIGGERDQLRRQRRGEDGCAKISENHALYGVLKPSYITYAARNSHHFAWHAHVAYMHAHRRALALARQAHFENSPKRAEQAMFFNAFADHFLADAFAAGHLRVPRQQVMDWAKGAGYSPMQAGVFSLILHDHDGAKDGLPVENSRGEQWRTLCDGQLFRDGDGRAAEMVAEAIAASVREVLQAFTEGTIPAGVYEALTYCPWPTDDGPALTEVFSPDLSDEELEEWMAPLPWYYWVPGLTRLTRGDFRRFFAALPEILEVFRSNVAVMSAAPEIRRRIPKALRDGLAAVR